MPALIPHFAALADRIRAYATPTTLDDREGYDVYPNQVEVITATWEGRIGDPDLTADEESLELLPRPEVKEVSSREVLSSGGRYTASDLRVGPITPAYDGPPAGGYTPAQLRPVAADNTVTGGATSTQVFYRLTGPLGGEYEIVDVKTEDPLEYWVTLRRKLSTP